MNDQQTEKIDAEINRLKELMYRSNGDLVTYIEGRIDSYKWIKENM